MAQRALAPEEATPVSSGVDEQAQLDAAIYELMRQTGVDPNDAAARDVAREVLLERESAEAPVEIDGVRYTQHGAEREGVHRIPVDRDVYNENLPDPGL